MRFKQNQQGFTLIELVIVIVLIGILVATTLPKFTNITTGQVKIAAAQGVAGALSAAVAVAHAQWIADGGTNAVNSITLEGGQTVFITDAGWPEDTTAPVISGTTTETGCLALWTGLLNNPPKAATATTGCTGACQYEVGIGPNTCIYTDGQGSGLNIITYNVLTGNVNL